MTTTIRFAQCRLEVNHDEHYAQTVFEDFSVAPARPNYEPSDVQRSFDLGYGGDCWQLCLDHECMHTWVAERMGEPYSVILWNVAHGGAHHWPPGGREEEGYVIAVQRFLRRGTTDDMLYGFFLRAQEVTGLRPERTVSEARAVLCEARRRREE